jgi:hypothetical protein
MFTALVFVVLAAGASVGQQKAGRLRSFHSEKFKIGFKYPSRWKAAESKDGITLTVPDYAYPRTNFVSADAKFGVEKATRAECRDRLTEGNADPNLGPNRKVTIGGITYDTVSSTEGAAGSRYSGRFTALIVAENATTSTFRYKPGLSTQK